MSVNWCDYCNHAHTDGPEHQCRALKAIAELQRENTALTQQLSRFAPSEEYRLSAADLHRIINECGAANDLSDAVKDLLLAHYEIDGNNREIQEFERIIASLCRGVDADTSKDEWYEAIARQFNNRNVRIDELEQALAVLVKWCEQDLYPRIHSGADAGRDIAEAKRLLAIPQPGVPNTKEKE